MAHKWASQNSPLEGWQPKADGVDLFTLVTNLSLYVMPECFYRASISENAIFCVKSVKK
jgi:hypothetical protein